MRLERIWTGFLKKDEKKMPCGIDNAIIAFILSY